MTQKSADYSSIDCAPLKAMEEGQKTVTYHGEPINQSINQSISIEIYVTKIGVKQ